MTISYTDAINFNYRQLEESGIKNCSPQMFFFIDDKHNLRAPMTHSATVQRKYDDVVAAVVLGCLPLISKHGADALKLQSDGTFDAIECKLAFKSKNQFTVTKNGAIYQGQGTSKTYLRNSIGAHYQIVNNLAKKNMPTFLVIVDEDDGRVIDALRLNGDQVVSMLSINGSDASLKRIGKNRAIKLPAFISNGTFVDIDHFEKVGLEQWEEEIRLHYFETKDAVDIEYVAI